MNDVRTAVHLTNLIYHFPEFLTVLVFQWIMQAHYMSIRYSKAVNLKRKSILMKCLSKMEFAQSSLHLMILLLALEIHQDLSGKEEHHHLC